ncbi:hypothetical protein PQX77_001984 [Marasmius sp. AFHP31]|nr:hypothetical protein PQX77_001984 [Marasmius sp. AFHP31]
MDGRAVKIPELVKALILMQVIPRVWEAATSKCLHDYSHESDDDDASSNDGNDNIKVPCAPGSKTGPTLNCVQDAILLEYERLNPQFTSRLTAVKHGGTNTPSFQQQQRPCPSQHQQQCGQQQQNNQQQHAPPLNQDKGKKKKQQQRGTRGGIDRDAGNSSGNRGGNRPHGHSHFASVASTITPPFSSVTKCKNRVALNAIKQSLRAEIATKPDNLWAGYCPLSTWDKTYPDINFKAASHIPSSHARGSPPPATLKAKKKNPANMQKLTGFKPLDSVFEDVCESCSLADRISVPKMARYLKPLEDVVATEARCTDQLASKAHSSIQERIGAVASLSKCTLEDDDRPGYSSTSSSKRSRSIGPDEVDEDRAEYQPTLCRPRMGGKVYYITSYGGQSYFYKAFMLKTKDQDLLDALFEASSSLRSVPDRFAKYPANDSVLSKPLMPDPLEAGPPNQFRRKCISPFTFNDYQEDGVPKIRANSKWDEASMSRLGCLKTLRQAHNASITIEKDPNKAIIKASLSDALKEGVNINSSKPLNFVNIPGHGETLFPGDMSTDAIAIKHTLFDLSLYNSSLSNFSWHIVSTKDAFSPIPMDAQGTAIMLTVEVGAKLVFMLVPKCSDYSAVLNISYSLDIALSPDDDPIHRLARRINCDVQGVLLLPGDVL